ncbi:MAG: precorrin-4 C(11)-methyltransferase [Tissierellia bacterium]|nr:precorrin-4 C(11)-methyltransferase [Tissierellia bacterium]
MIYFVGAGPGDPDLITVKGRKALEEADIIIYAGSLVSPKHLDWAKDNCEIYNSAKMHLDEVLDVMIRGAKDGKDIVRLHTGDPSIYGAIQEQMDPLEDEGIEFEVIPGVSSFVAAASSIKREFTLPDVSQTVILTRMAGRTPVPEEENLKSLAAHKASMALFLSVGNMDGVVKALKEGYGSGDVPVAVVYRATWEDEKRIFGTLDTIVAKVKEEKIIKQAQILVGDFLDSEYSKSKLYDKTFTTEYRQGIQE